MSLARCLLFRLLTTLPVFVGFVAGQRPTEKSAVGVLYRVQGGLVGSASGSFVIASGDKELTLHFQGASYRSPFGRSGFDAPDSEEIGAIYRVGTTR